MARTCVNGDQFGTDPETGALFIKTKELAGASIRGTFGQTLPASTGRCVIARTPIRFQAVEFSHQVRQVRLNPGQIVIDHPGHYLITGGCRTTPAQANTTVSGRFITVGIALEVNGVQVAGQRQPRLYEQSDLLSASRIIPLNAGDVVALSMNLHNTDRTVPFVGTQPFPIPADPRGAWLGVHEFSETEVPSDNNATTP